MNVILSLLMFNINFFRNDNKTAVELNLANLSNSTINGRIYKRINQDIYFREGRFSFLPFLAKLGMYEVVNENDIKNYVIKELKNCDNVQITKIIQIFNNTFDKKINSSDIFPIFNEQQLKDLYEKIPPSEEAAINNDKNFTAYGIDKVKSKMDSYQSAAKSLTSNVYHAGHRIRCLRYLKNNGIPEFPKNYEEYTKLAYQKKYPGAPPSSPPKNYSALLLLNNQIAFPPAEYDFLLSEDEFYALKSIGVVQRERIMNFQKIQSLEEIIANPTLFQNWNQFYEAHQEIKNIESKIDPYAVPTNYQKNIYREWYADKIPDKLKNLESKFSDFSNIDPSIFLESKKKSLEENTFDFPLIFEAEDLIKSLSLSDLEIKQARLLIPGFEEAYQLSNFDNFSKNIPMLEELHRINSCYNNLTENYKGLENSRNISFCYALINNDQTSPMMYDWNRLPSHLQIQFLSKEVSFESLLQSRPDELSKIVEKNPDALTLEEKLFINNISRIRWSLKENLKVDWGHERLKKIEGYELFNRLADLNGEIPAMAKLESDLIIAEKFKQSQDQNLLTNNLFSKPEWLKEWKNLPQDIKDFTVTREVQEKIDRLIEIKKIFDELDEKFWKIDINYLTQKEFDDNQGLDDEDCKNIINAKKTLNKIHDHDLPESLKAKFEFVKAIADLANEQLRFQTNSTCDAIQAIITNIDPNIYKIMSSTDNNEIIKCLNNKPTYEDHIRPIMFAKDIYNSLMEKKIDLDNVLLFPNLERFLGLVSLYNQFSNYPQVLKVLNSRSNFLLKERIRTGLKQSTFVNPWKE